MTATLRAAAGVLILALTGCATTRMGTAGDPLERMNRATYRFNDAVDRKLLRPVARSYREHVPGVVQEGVDNVLETSHSRRRSSTTCCSSRSRTRWSISGASS
jgi:ABC-type transporter lipoprotein component MlaA